MASSAESIGPSAFRSGPSCRAIAISAERSTRCSETYTPAWKATRQRHSPVCAQRACLSRWGDAEGAGNGCEAEALLEAALAFVRRKFADEARRVAIAKDLHLVRERPAVDLAHVPPIIRPQLLRRVRSMF